MKTKCNPNGVDVAAVIVVVNIVNVVADGHDEHAGIQRSLGLRRIAAHVTSGCCQPPTTAVLLLTSGQTTTATTTSLATSGKIDNDIKSIRVK